VLAVVISNLASSGFLSLGPGWRGTLQYLAAIMLLTPSIATLGARRPGCGPWQWFVVLPMILVLIWPVFAQALNTSGRTSVQLSNPQLCGFCLAALLGLGPGLGTAATAALLLRLSAILMALLPLRTSSEWADLAASTVALVLLTESYVQEQLIRGHLLRLREATTDAARSFEIWQMFLTLYGTVWPRRVQDRISQFERGERWSVTLDITGFQTHSGQTPEDCELQKPLVAFRWLMSRFVSNDWLQRELPERTSGRQGSGRESGDGTSRVENADLIRIRCTVPATQPRLPNQRPGGRPRSNLEPNVQHGGLSRRVER
jgi:hypothetical protein